MDNLPRLRQACFCFGSHWWNSILLITGRADYCIYFLLEGNFFIYWEKQSLKLRMWTAIFLDPVSGNKLLSESEIWIECSFFLPLIRFYIPFEQADWRWFWFLQIDCENQLCIHKRAICNTLLTWNVKSSLWLATNRMQAPLPTCNQDSNLVVSKEQKDAFSKGIWKRRQQNIDYLY